MSPIQKAKDLVFNYCKAFDIEERHLKIAYGKTGRAKKINGIHIDRMRMCLAYYLENNTSIQLVKIAEIVGYKCHSTICQNRKKVEHYLRVSDPYISPYWYALSCIVG
jgi:hypothetical protein